MDTNFDFSGKSFVVTGASSGIGRQVALELLQAGATVLLIARRKEKLKELCGVASGKAVPGVADVKDTAALKQIISEFTEQYGSLDGAVHAAGITGNTPLRIYSDELAREIMEISFWSGIRLMQLVNNRRYSNDGCSSVLFSSATAYIGEKGLFAYAASKAALQAAVRSIAKEISKQKSRINTISPGWVTTEMTEREQREAVVSEEIYQRHLLGIGKPEDVSGMVLFLLSQRASWITGQDFVVDGGYLFS